MRNRLLFAVLVLIVFLSVAYAKDYTLQKAQIDYEIMPNSSIAVKQSITYDFSGSFSYAYIDLPLGEWGFEDIAVFDEMGADLKAEGSYVGKYFRVKWFYSAGNETRTFTIRYTLKNALKVYDDVAEFYWKVWGEGWEKGVAEIEGSVLLPAAVENPKDVYTWGHPSLEGKIGISENRKIVFRAFGIPAGQWVEVRVAFPGKLIESAEHAIVIQGMGLEKIVAEENSYALFDSILLYLNPVWFIPLIVILVFVALWHFYGREPKTGYNALYEREPPYSYSPAILSALINQHTRKPVVNDILAVILDLCLKGYFKLQRTEAKRQFGIFGRKYDYEIILQKNAINKKAAELTGQEKKVLELVLKFAKGSEKISFTEIEKKIKNAPGSFMAWADSWQKSVKGEAEKMAFFERPAGKSLFTIFLVVLAFIGAVGVFSYYLFEIYLYAVFLLLVFVIVPGALKLLSHRRRVFEKIGIKGLKKAFKEDLQSAFLKVSIVIYAFILLLFKQELLSFFTGRFGIALTIGALAGVFAGIILMAVFKSALPKRSALGALHYAKWINLKRFLQDFSRLKEMPPDAIVLWEKYLVYAIPLGVAKNVQKAMESVFKDYDKEIHSNIFPRAQLH